MMLLKMKMKMKMKRKLKVTERKLRKSIMDNHNKLPLK